MRGGPSPRRPWTEPLPTELSIEQLPEPAVPGEAVVGVADQPHRQRRAPWTWTPHDDGNLLLVGTSGWGPTQALLTIAASLADHHDPDQVHLYGIDHGPGELTALGVLPHVGTIVAPDDLDRQRRLLRHLRTLVDTRRRSPGGPTTVLLLDGLAGFRAAFEDIDLAPYRDMLQEIAAAGPQHGVFVVATADQNRIVPSSLAGAMSSRLVFNLADKLEYGMLGVRGQVPELPRRRAIDPVTQEHVHIASTDDEHLARVAARASLATRTPEPILTLPRRVELVEVLDAGGQDDDGWQFPIGLDDETLTAATIAVYGGDHLLVAGPGRSGRSTTLTLIATAARKLAPSARILAVAPRPSPLRLHPAIDTVVRSTEELGDLPTEGPVVVLVDDADEVDDGGRLGAVIEARTAGITIVAAGRTDALRGAHRHWTKGIRSGRRGIILKPFDSADGDVLGIRLPRSARPFTTNGRGYLVDGGEARLVQVACP